MKLGTKWTCFSCTTRFYDLNRAEPTCPNCGADQRESPQVVVEKTKKKAKPKAKSKAKPKAKKKPPPPPPPKKLEPEEAAEGEADSDPEDAVDVDLEPEVEDIDLDDLEITGSEDIADEDTDTKD
jgi:uncharacterized protein (TIGR02300 family)